MIVIEICGGLGNQMFQYAYGRALSRRRGVELALHWSDEDPETPRRFELDRIFDIKARIVTGSEVKAFMGWQHNRLVRRFIVRSGARRLLSRYIEEPHFHFAAQMQQVPDRVYLKGYWQSERYFSDAICSLRDDFSFRRPLSGRNEALVQEMTRGEETPISLHVRRGDFVSSESVRQKHGSCTLEYYRLAIDYLAERVPRPRFLLFSDDMSWVRARLRPSFPHLLVEHNQGAASFEDMRLMSLCRHHIIANSSFSWWGAWLNPGPEKIVVAPVKWFADQTDVADLLPKGWVQL